MQTVSLDSEPSVQPVEVRKTREKNNSNMYLNAMPRKVREERLAQQNESTSRMPEPLEVEVC